MPRPRTGNPVGRPFTYTTDEERPITVSLRIPHDLHEQAKRYVRMRHPMTLTELLLDGLRLRLETSVDPRDIILSDDNTVIQELQDMIRAAVQAEVGKLSDFMGPHVGIPGSMPVSEAPVAPTPEISYDDNTVLQESHDTPPIAKQPAAVPVETSSPAPGSAPDKAAIIAMLQAMRDEGLSLREMAEQLQAENIPTLSGKGRWQKGTVDKLLHTAIA